MPATLALCAEQRRIEAICAVSRCAARLCVWTWHKVQTAKFMMGRGTCLTEVRCSQVAALHLRALMRCMR